MKKILSLRDSPRRAYVILGPEISGTKLLAEILLKCCGLHGKVEDGSFPDRSHDKVLIRWSLPSGVFDLPYPDPLQKIPHCRRMVDVEHISRLLVSADYLPVFIFIGRSWSAVTASRMSRNYDWNEHLRSLYGDPADPTTHFNMLREAFEYFFARVPPLGFPWFSVGYEDITSDPEGSLKALSASLDLPFLGLDNLNWKISNQNNKWYSDNPEASSGGFHFDTWG